MLCEILKVGELRKSTSTTRHPYPPDSTYPRWRFLLILQHFFCLHAPQSEHRGSRKCIQGSTLPTGMHIVMYTKIQTSRHISTHIPSMLRWKQPLCSIIVLPGVHYLVMHLTPLRPFQPNILPPGGPLTQRKRCCTHVHSKLMCPFHLSLLV